MLKLWHFVEIKNGQGSKRDYTRPCTISQITIQIRCQADVLEDGSVWYRFEDIKTGEWMEWDMLEWVY